MNKKQMVQAISTDTKLSQTQVEKVLDSFQVTVKKTVKKGDRVQLIGFGAFESRSRKARMGVNPATKEKIKIKAKKVVVFRPGKEFKSLISPSK